MEKNTALDLFFEVSLRHLYTAEHENYDSLALLARNSSSSRLSDLLYHHREETDRQIGRLEQVFRRLNIDIHSSKLRGMTDIVDQGRELMRTLADFNFTDKSRGMIGIINEGKELIRHFAQTDAGDLALISAGRKVEHFEIACYQSICLLADIYGQRQILDLMRESLHEEGQMQERLLELAQQEIAPALMAPRRR